jgi:hypothetical protein
VVSKPFLDGIDYNGIDIENGRALKKPIKKANDNESKYLIRLIQTMRDDDLINKKVIEMLKLDSYQRRSVLNNWLERLRMENAPQNLLSALSCLFDDKIAEQVLALINDPKI